MPVFEPLILRQSVPDLNLPFVMHQHLAHQAMDKVFLLCVRALSHHLLKVVIETVAAQEYLAQDAERWMAVKRVKRTTDKVARAFWLQPFFENGQILMPAKHLTGDHSLWQALMDELLLFPQREHDDLFDGLQTMVEGATSYAMVRAYRYSPIVRL